MSSGKWYNTDFNWTCGLDNTNINIVYEGLGDIQNYPWLGTLYYPVGQHVITTAVVLVTMQIVIGSAKEFDLLPKHDIRSRSRVVLGRRCGGHSIRVRDYSFHPEHSQDSSTLVMIQMDVDLLQQELRPICGPPSYFINPQIYAMTIGDCNNGTVHIYKMKYVDSERCKQFYRKSGLDSSTYWSSSMICTRTQSPRKCYWRGGTTLVLKQDGHWKLLGFGVHGPGCGAPAMFLDYGAYLPWVWNSIARIGKPAITRLGDDHIILRRSVSNMQRYGECDPEETKYEIYTDQITITGNHDIITRASTSYNVTLYANVEYSCIVMRARGYKVIPDEELEPRVDPKTNCTLKPTRNTPRIHLRRWCSDSGGMCYGFQYVEVHFYVEIEFKSELYFSISAYGKAGKIISPLKAMQYANKIAKPVYMKRPSYRTVLTNLRLFKDNRTHRWFYKDDIAL